MNAYQFFYKTLRKIIIGPLYRVKVEGVENIPKDGPVIVCCNHTAMLDAAVLAAASPRQIRFMAKKEAFDIPILGKVIDACGAFPVDRGGSDISAIKTGIAVLSQGQVMGIFPQGTRCPGVHPSETLDKLHGGVAMIAARSKATLVPACIETNGHKLRPFRKTRFRVGKPITYEEYTDNGRMRTQYQEITRTVFERICELYDESRKENVK